MPATAIVCVRISCHFFPSQKPWACVLLAWEKRCLRRNTAANPCFVNVFSKRYKIEKLVLSLWVRISWRKTWTQIETIICLSATPWHLLRLTLYRMRWANIKEQKPPMRWHQRHNFYFRLSILGYDRIIFSLSIRSFSFACMQKDIQTAHCTWQTTMPSSRDNFNWFFLSLDWSNIMMSKVKFR